MGRLQSGRGGWQREGSRAQRCLALSSCGWASCKISLDDDSCNKSSFFPRDGGLQKITGASCLGWPHCHLLPLGVLSIGCWRSREEKGHQPGAPPIETQGKKVGKIGNVVNFWWGGRGHSPWEHSCKEQKSEGKAGWVKYNRVQQQSCGAEESSVITKEQERASNIKETQEKDGRSRTVKKNVEVKEHFGKEKEGGNPWQNQLFGAG